MSLILAIETGTDICSVGIAKDGELLSLRESDEGPLPTATASSSSGAMSVSRSSSSTNTPTLRAWSRPSSLSRSESSSPSFAIPTEQTSVPVSIHRIKLISSINSNSIVQNTQVLQRPGNAVVVDRSGHVVSGVQRLVAGIAHGNPHPRGRQHRHVVAAVAEGRDLRSP